MSANSKRKKSRGLRWLGCLGVIVALVVGLFLANAAGKTIVQRRIARVDEAMAARGFAVTADALIARQNDTENLDNGAPEIVAALDAFDDDGIDYKLIPVFSGLELPPPGEDFPPEVLAEMEKFVALNAEALDLLHRGVRAEAVRFAIDTDELFSGEGWPWPPERGARMRDAARLAYVAALLYSETGETDHAVDAVETLTRVGIVYGQQPLFRAYLIGGAIMSMASACGREVIERHPDDGDFAVRVAEVMAVPPESINPVASMWGDVVLSLATARRRIKEIHDQYADYVDPSGLGELRNSVETWVYPGSIWETLDAFNAKQRVYAFARALDGPSYTVPDRFDELAVPESRPLFNFDVAEIFQPYINHSSLGLPALFLARFRTAEFAARAVAYRAHEGTLPDDLTALEPSSERLRDPFTGEPLRYKIQPHGFLIYSVGLNRVDDGGWDVEADDRAGDDVAVRIRLE